MGPMRYLMHTLISELELTIFAINLIKRNVHEPLSLEFIMKKEIHMQQRKYSYID
jgi:hypothetical protein